MSRNQLKQKNVTVRRTPSGAEPVTVSSHSTIVLDSARYFWSEWDTLKVKGFWTIGTTAEVKLYNATTISEDMTELISVTHRTEGKVDDIKNILEKVAEKLEVSTDGDTEQDEMMCLNVSDDEAREMIIEYMKSHERAWPQDISSELRLDFGQVMRITTELLKKGVLSDIESE